MIFATLNAQGLSSKKQIIFLEMARRSFEVIVLSETKLKGYGEEVYHDYVHLWSGVPKDNRAKRGVLILIHKRRHHPE